MIIVMKPEATEEQIQQVIDRLIRDDYDVHRSTGVERTILGAVGSRVPDVEPYRTLPGVEDVFRITKKQPE